MGEITILLEAQDKVVIEDIWETVKIHLCVHAFLQSTFTIAPYGAYVPLRPPLIPLQTAFIDYRILFH